MIVAFTLLLAYFLGSIPFGLLLTKLAGHGDIRSIGSGNIGATNVMRTGNKKLAALVLLLDGLKGYMAVIVAQYIWLNILFHNNYFFSTFAPWLAGLASILGHIFSPWLNFKGGKGVATAIGTILALFYPLATFIIVLWLLSFILFRISSLSALLSFLVTTLLGEAACYWNSIYDMFLNFADAYTNCSYPLGSLDCLFMPFVNIQYLLLVTFLLFFTHRANIKRLLKGTEPSWSKKV